jgi:hypothetical protein
MEQEKENVSVLVDAWNHGFDCRGLKGCGRSIYGGQDHRFAGALSLTRNYEISNGCFMSEYLYY